MKQVFERSAKRSVGKPLIEIFEPAANDPAFARRETVVLAVNDDIPFLYDSATAELRAQGVNVTAAFHPIINDARDASGMRSAGGTAVAESFILLVLDSTIDEERKTSIREGLVKVFANVALVVRDWKPMLARLAETIGQLKKHPPAIQDADLAENLAFLGWLADNHFTFLGCRDYVFRDEGEGKLEARYESGLGVLAEPETRVIRRDADRSSLTPELREFLKQPAPIIITKSSTRSVVHRRAHMDYIGVKNFDANGKLLGERRFVGLFTSVAYGQLPSRDPAVAAKGGECARKIGAAAVGSRWQGAGACVEHIPARRIVPDPGRRAAADRSQHPQSRRTAEGAGLPSLRQVRPLRVRARVPAARALQRNDPGANPRVAGPSVRRPDVGGDAHARRRVAGAHPLHRRTQSGPAA